MVENRRNQEGRNGENPGSVHNGNEKIRHLYPSGFDVINYEQHREPYRGNHCNGERENMNGDKNHSKRRDANYAVR